ncbi:MAG: flagellar biosynthetic protein FliO [Chitinispirillales bacterium]|jgi:flagellar biogenesis protein FliO|nr:flagellar biosynthetic protein FliO [Chitinispirillales bacterium]
MKKVFVVVFSAFLVYVVYAQELKFDMSQLNQSMGNIVSQDSDFVDSADGNQDGVGIILLRIVGSLALVLAIFAAAVWGIRKSGIMGHGAAVPALQTPSMSVLEALSTGYNGTILLVRCEEQVFLIGQTPANYTFLQELQEGVAKKIIESKGGGETIGAFKNSLANFMQNLKIQKNTLQS